MTRDTHLGPVLQAGIGVHATRLVARGLSAAIGYQLEYAPVIENELGETHAGGGHRLIVALGYSL
jgi:hypothetical protein